uniref:Uncharacterized protein n=1 Tax=Solanum tuberosum TaxID=4113 RepID=M1BP26_SOLTU
MAMLQRFLLLCIFFISASAAKVQTKVTDNPADELASSLAQITGRFLACQSKYAEPSEAFNDILIRNTKSLDILYSKNHTEVGAAVSGSGGGGPYFWCVLFSNGKPKSSFSTGGVEPKVSRPGCFSGSNDQCSGANSLSQTIYLWTITVGASIALLYALGV